MTNDPPNQWLLPDSLARNLILQPPSSLKKRHSAYTLSQQLPDIRIIPQLQPQFHPTIMSTLHSNSRRPSVPVTKREDITPWEFQTTPPSHFTPATVRSRTSLPAGLVEEVTPWELYPVPNVLPESSPRKSKHLRAGRPLSASGSNKALQDLGIVGGRRKSSGSKASSNTQRAIRPTATPSTSSLSLHQPPSLQVHAPVASEHLFTEPFAYTSAYSASATSIPHPPSPDSMPRSPFPVKFLALKKTPSTSKLEPARQNGTGGDPKFSTADRKILHEIELNQNAREASFEKKGRDVGFGRNGALPGKKHHPHPRQQVPYPRNYERDVLDLDVWETAFCQDACGSVTWHVFETPPTKVLDLGCGTGSWVLNCAKVWKDCHFVGLDIVPIQPDLSHVGSPDLKSRITWRHANFLDKLPFPDGEFDYVHVKRIALGVPEDKWDSLLEEITRVMKRGGTFELIEEDLFFPGKQVDSDSESDCDSEDTKSGLQQSYVESAVVSHDPFSSASRPDSPVPIRERTIAETEELEGDEEVRDYEVVRLPPSSSSYFGTPTPRPSLQVKTSQDTWHPPRSRLPMPKRSTSTLSLPSANNGHSPIKFSDAKALSADPKMAHIPLPPTPEETPSVSSDALVRTMPKRPNNPRDHWLLERIYYEMLASRFINVSPLSLLANSLSLYFKDLRTHPAIQFTFPPLPPRKFRIFGKVEERKPEEILKKKQSDYLSSDGETCGYETEMDERSKILSMQSLLQHESRYVSLDETRPSAFSPSTRMDSLDPSRDLKISAIRRASRLPNQQLHLDLKTLNMHLTLRMEEVLACSESMWEWVREEQTRMKQNKTRTSTSSSRSRESYGDRIVDMTRDEFDELLSYFRLDMQDKCSLGYAQTDRFNWSISLCQPPPERITFDGACEKWKKWERQERQAAAIRSRRSTSYLRPRAVSSSNLSHVSSTTSTISSPQVTWTHSGQSGHSSHSGQTLLSGHSVGSSTLVPPITDRWDQQSQYHLSLRPEPKLISGHDSNGSESTARHRNGRTRQSSCAAHVPPTTRMSRALKVFVGWKP